LRNRLSQLLTRANDLKSNTKIPEPIRIKIGILEFCNFDVCEDINQWLHFLYVRFLVCNIPGLGRKKS